MGPVRPLLGDGAPVTPGWLSKEMMLVKLRGLLLAAALLLAVPLGAQAAPAPDGVDYCGTPYPFWWIPHDLPGPVSVTDIKVEPVDGEYEVTLFLQNASTEFFEGGLPFVVSRAIVDASIYPDPASGQLPEHPGALLQAETIYADSLPALEPGAETSITLRVSDLGDGYNNLLTTTTYNPNSFDLICPDWWPHRWWIRRPVLVWPRPWPWPWPSPWPNPWPWPWPPPPGPWPGPWYADFLELEDAVLDEVGSQYDGFEGRYVKLTYRNVSDHVLPAGTKVRLGHGSSGSAEGYWGPDDIIDPNNPINPYATFFRQTLAETVLEQDLQPGEALTLEGLAHSPVGTELDTLNFITLTMELPE